MRTIPTDDDVDDVKALNAEPWMLDLLHLNPSYPHWGPHEDYMWKKGDGWDCPRILPTWADFSWELNDMNECVHFYFSVERASQQCAACDGQGYNPDTRAIADGFYAFDGPRGSGWNDKITQDEADMLWDAGRLRVDFKEKPTAEAVNSWQRGRGLGHDAINRWKLIETRATRLGVYGKCASCGGNGYIYTAPSAHVSLTLWMLHPRKGCSRGVEITRIDRTDLPAVFAWLTTAAERNAERFARVVSRGMAVAQ